MKLAMTVKKSPININQYGEHPYDCYLLGINTDVKQATSNFKF
jgi:hypothetical protein